MTPAPTNPAPAAGTFRDALEKLEQVTRRCWKGEAGSFELIRTLNETRNLLASQPAPTDPAPAADEGASEWAKQRVRKVDADWEQDPAYHKDDRISYGRRAELFALALDEAHAAAPPASVGDGLVDTLLMLAKLEQSEVCREYLGKAAAALTAAPPAPVADRWREAVMEIGRRARSNHNRTMDELMKDMGWIDDHCRWILNSAAAPPAPVADNVCLNCGGYLYRWGMGVENGLCQRCRTEPAPPAPVGDVGGLAKRLRKRAKQWYPNDAPGAELDHKAAAALTALSARVVELERARDVERERMRKLAGAYIVLGERAEQRAEEAERERDDALRDRYYIEPEHDPDGIGVTWKDFVGSDARAEAAEQRAEEAIRETGELRSGITNAMGMQWHGQPSNGMVCPDDKDIIARAEALSAERDAYRSDKKAAEELYDNLLTTWAESRERHLAAEQRAEEAERELAQLKGEK